jgi:hypothetical protein
LGASSWRPGSRRWFWSLKIGGIVLVLKLILAGWVVIISLYIIIKLLVKKLDPTKKYEYKIKNPILKFVFGVSFILVMVSLLLCTFTALPIAIPLSKLFPNNIEATLRRGLKLKFKGKTYFSMNW